MFSENDESKNLTTLIIEKLIEMFNENNKLVKLFQLIRDRYKKEDISYMKLRLIDRRYNDSPEYDLPTSRDISGLIVEDIDEHEHDRDIIVHRKAEGLQRITKLHPSYMALQYLILFPYNEDNHIINRKYHM